MTLFSIFWASGFWLFLGMLCETLKSAKLPQMNSKTEAKMAPKSHFAAVGRKRVGYAIYCIFGHTAGLGRLSKAIRNPVRFRNPFRARFLRILAGFGRPCGWPFGSIFDFFRVRFSLRFLSGFLDGLREVRGPPAASIPSHPGGGDSFQEIPLADLLEVLA